MSSELTGVAEWFENPVLKEFGDYIMRQLETLKDMASTALTVNKTWAAIMKEVIDAFMRFMSTLWGLFHLDQASFKVGDQAQINTVIQPLKELFSNPMQWIKDAFLKSSAKENDKSASIDEGADYMSGKLELFENIKSVFETVASIFKMECLTDSDCVEIYGAAGKSICDNT